MSTIYKENLTSDELAALTSAGWAIAQGPWQTTGSVSRTAYVLTAFDVAPTALSAPITTASSTGG
jgi:hypothetical protein